MVYQKPPKSELRPWTNIKFKQTDWLSNSQGIDIDNMDFRNPKAFRAASESIAYLFKMAPIKNISDNNQ